MASPLIARLKSPRDDRPSLVFPIVVLWGIVVLAVSAFLWIEYDLGSTIEDLYLLPWLALLALVVLAPSIYFFAKGQFDLFHPLVFHALSYLFPAFVIGGCLVAFGIVNPYFVTFVEDQRYNYPYTAAIIAIGYLGVIVGYALPIGKKIAEFIEPRLPKWDWNPENVWVPGVALVLAGIAMNLLGFFQGLLGFQRAESVNIYDGTLFFLFVLLLEGTVLLWLAIFTVRQRTGVWYLVLGLLIVFIPIRMAVLGSRASLIIGLLPIAYAFVYSGRKLKTKTFLAFGVIAVLAAFIGATYATAFRNIKGSESRVGASDYFGQIAVTLDYLVSTDPAKVFGDSANALAERVENFSSVAVVVSRYEKLAPFEESYGLQNNIINDAYTSFIPRFVWSDKPPTSDARAYSDLYFNFSENSFAISPFGDLIRNFGLIGVPIGMLLLGLYLRVLYEALVQTTAPALWKKTAYYLLLTVISYEGFYAHYFPSTIRYLFVIGLSLFIANFFVGSLRRS